MFKHTLVGVVAVFAAFGVSARTVYDAGKALHANITSSAPVGADGSIYTDAQGGKWQYLRANDNLATSTAAFKKSVTSGTYYRGIGGTSSRSGSPFIHVNVSGAATRDGVTDGAVAAEPVDADEFYVHPGDPGSANHYVVLRFVVPETGWYSAFVTAHDVNGNGPKLESNGGKSAGAEIRLLANNVMQVHGVVRLEDYYGGDSAYLLTRRFDFQMPVRRMTAGETIDFMVGANGAHTSDATGLKVFVTKEDDGAFYDSGLALKENVLGSSLNPFGTISNGMWYCYYADTSAAQSLSSFTTGACPADYFAIWTPGQLTKKLTLLDSSYTRTAAPLLKGFFLSTRLGQSPYICVNQTSANASDVAPQELYAHPHAGNWTQWPVLRFRPPRGGMYSASVVLRDVARNTSTEDSDGVMVYLLVDEKVVTNAVVCAETLKATAHFTFDARFIAANEPVDIVVSPHNGHASDSTTISAIFRREVDAYDVGFSMAALAKANGAAPSRPFADAVGVGATWDVGQAASAKETFTTMPYAFKRVNNNIDFFGYGQNATDGSLPRVMVSTNGVAQNYNSGDGKRYRMGPCELWAHPNSSGNKCPVVCAAVPADGIYHVRAYARDISSGGDGVYAGLSVGGSIPAWKRISIEVAGVPDEEAIDGDRLWLKARDKIDAVIDPVGSNTSDGTCWSVCYIKECDADAGRRVVNVHVTQRGSGKFSPTTQRPREGWADWSTWNALRPGDAASAVCKNCYEGDGTTQRNMTVTLTRDSGAAIGYGENSAANIYSYASSTATNDTYTFTIGKLKKNKPYSLYLYSAKTASGGGNAIFTVGGITKSLDETWIIDGVTKVLTRFDVTSDANGEITGKFAAKDSNGGAFNGFTLVGEFPNYVAPGMVLFVR